MVLIIYHASEITWRAGSITNCGLHCRVFDSGCCRQGLRICIPNTFLGVPAAGGLRTIPGEYIPTPQRHEASAFSVSLFYSFVFFRDNVWPFVQQESCCYQKETRASYPHLFSWVFQNIQNSRSHFSFFSCLSTHHCSGEFRHDHNHQGQFKTPHDHVLFP